MSENALTIVMPAYNEEDGLAATMDHLLKMVPEFPIDHVEIVLVDDGSTDKTAEIAAQYDEIHLIRHPRNRGYGAALKTGIRHAAHDVICIIDADNTYPVEMIPTLFQHMREIEADMVVGARTGEDVNIPLIRRPAKAVLRQLANYVVEDTIPDLNSGLRLFRRKGALAFFSLLPNQFSFTTTITLAMLINGYTVDYVPINYHARMGRSKIKPIRDTLRFTQLVLRMALYFNPLRIFIPLSIFFLLAGIVWGIFSIAVLGRFADASTIVIITTAVQVLGIGLLAELVNKRTPNEFIYE